MPESIFAQARYAQGVGEIEFRYFKKIAVKQIEQIRKTNPRFASVEREFGFWVDNQPAENQLQLSFGKQAAAKRNNGAAIESEEGPQLLYSLGPAHGFAATVLFPSRSTVGQVSEGYIFIRIGAYSAHQLFDRLASDINDLVSYAFVSSIDTTPSVRDKLRFWWLRKTHPQQLEGKFVRPLTPGAILSAASRFTITSLLIALLRPLGIAIAYALLVLLGFANLTTHMHW